MSGWRARLDALPRLSLVEQPTPLLHADHLSRSRRSSRLWFKRDDLIPAAFGGNKVRALDLVAADALRQGADTLITGAGPLSNHVRATAAAATLCGLGCIAVYWGEKPPRTEGNHRLATMLGADMRFTGNQDRASVDPWLEQIAAQVRAGGGKPYVIPRGGACALAAVAHVLAVRETLAQCVALGISPTCVVMAVGGAATLAGWLLGSALFNAPWRIEAFTVSRPAQEAAARARSLAAAGSAILDAPDLSGRIPLKIHDGFIGAGYGVPSREGQEAIVATLRAEAVVLDPVYTGKAMAGYRALSERGDFAGDGDVLFLHTGGAPTLFTIAGEGP